MSLTNREKFIILVDNDCIKKGDAIILLEGDGYSRVERAVELYQGKWAPKIVFSGGIINHPYGSYEASLVIPKLISCGVSASDIFLEEKSQNTHEQAKFIIDLALEKIWTRLLLIGSHYHQYRAYLTFLNIILKNKNNIELINTPSTNLLWFESLDWGNRYDLLKSEFTKIEQYSALNHLASYEDAIEYQKWKEQRQ